MKNVLPIDRQEKNLMSPFNRCGLASRDDLETVEWKNLFSELEQAQKEFAETFDARRSPEYVCKKLPLYDFSRCWEYPYVYDNLNRLFSDPTKIHIVDHGCGVTFFPFHLMKKGYSVIGVDIDPVTEDDFSKALRFFTDLNGKGTFKKVTNNILPFPDSSIDALYSISVLEHIPDPHNAIIEIARILKKKGKFILTMDIDLVGNLELSPQKLKSIMAEINSHFNIIAPETTIHPKNLITTKNSPYPFIINQTLFKKVTRPFWEFIKPLLGKPKAVFPIVSVCGYVLKKK